MGNSMSINHSQSSSNGKNVSQISAGSKSHSSKQRASSHRNGRTQPNKEASRNRRGDEQASRSKDTSNSKRSYSGYSVNISEKGAKAAKSESKKATAAVVQSHE